MEALLYDTTYYVKLVAKDTDGSAAASAAGSAQLLSSEGPDIRAGSITTDHIAARSITAWEIDVHVITAEHIVAGTITAEEIAAETIEAENIAAEAVTADKLEASLVLSTTIVAGTAEGARIELGTSDGGTGLMAYATDGETIKFSVNAESGDVYVAGRIDFGQGSRLDSDIVSLKELPSTGYQTPAVVQTASDVDTGSTVSLAWENPTTVGNVCLFIVSLWDIDGTVPTPTPPTGYSLVTSTTSAGLGTFIYRASSGASRSSTESITLHDTCLVSMLLVELSGVQVAAADKTVIATGTSTSPASGSTAATTQTDEMLIGVVAWNNQAAGVVVTLSGETSGFTSFGTLFTGVISGTDDGIAQRVYWKKVTAADAYSFGGTLSTSRLWAAACITLKAKTSAIDAPEADKLRIYAIDDGHASTGNDAATLVMQNELGVEKSLEYPGMGRFHASAPTFSYVWSEFLEASGAMALSEAVATGVILWSSAAGAGVGGIAVSTGNHPGVIRASTGTTANGEAEVYGSASGYIVGSGRMRLGAYVRVPTQSTLLERFHCGVAFKSFVGAWGNIGPSGNFIGIRYSDGTNSGKWQAATAGGGASLTADTGITVNANQWYWLEVDVNAAGTQATFYVDGVLCATIDTAAGFPAVAATFTHFVGMNKSNGGTARSYDIDFYYCYVETGTRS